MDIYLVVVEYRHTDVRIYPFSSFEKATEAMDDCIEDYGLEEEGYPEDCENPNPDMLLRYFRCSYEGNCIYIEKKILDAEIEL